VTLLRDATKFVEDGTNGALLGDSGILNLMRNLRSLVTGSATGVSGDIRTLADIGLNFGAVGSDVGTTGLLLFNSTTFNDAVRDHAVAVTRMLTAFSASASLKAGGDGAVVSVTGTPTNVTDSGDYEFTTTASGNLTMTFRADDGSAPRVTTVTISPGEVNTTLIPGLTITFPDPLIDGVDIIEIDTVEEGVAKVLYEYVNSFTRSGGVMRARNAEMQARIDDINDQIERMQTRLDSKREQLIRKFAQLEVTMQRLQNQQAALSMFVNQLQANRRTS
jgi:flagellar hook-associated protein 2